MRKRLTFLLIALLLAAGCTTARRQPEPDPPPPPPVEQVVTLRFGLRGSIIGGPLDVLIAGFQQQHPGYRVEKVDSPPDFMGPGTITSWLNEHQIDVVDQGFWAWSKGQHITVRPLDPFVARGRLNLALCGGTAESVKIGGAQLGLPLTRVPVVLVANRQRLTEAGLTVPEQGWTWQQFRDAAAQLTRGEGETKVWGLAVQFPHMAVQAWVEERAGRSWDDAEPADMGEALRFFREMAERDQTVYPIPEWVAGQRWPPIPVFDLVQGGAAALGFVRLDLIPEAGDSLVILPFPAHDPARRITPSEVFYLSMAVSTEQQEAAWQFIQFALSDEGGKALATAGLLPACPTEAARDAWFGRRPAPQAGTSSFFTTRWATARPQAPEEMLYDTLRANVALKVLAQKMTADQGVALLQAGKADAWKALQQLAR